MKIKEFLNNLENSYITRFLLKSTNTTLVACTGALLFIYFFRELSSII